MFSRGLPPRMVPPLEPTQKTATDGVGVRGKQQDAILPPLALLPATNVQAGAGAHS
jgi:hypothetical protein